MRKGKVLYLRGLEITKWPSKDIAQVMSKLKILSVIILHEFASTTHLNYSLILQKNETAYSSCGDLSTMAEAKETDMVKAYSQKNRAEKFKTVAWTTNIIHTVAP